ncbi:hypothetical protein [Streptomyces sp. NPDC096132]|uniref:hypothetical protein n=1 Tax=Streptomyces sp. NPDC096132 TaxID=3366075 RepID=UPI00380AE563
MRRVQRTLLLVNVVPLVVGSLLSSFTDIPAIFLYRRLTLGMVWGLLQICLFVITAWLFELRSQRLCDPVEVSLNSELSQVKW